MTSDLDPTAVAAYQTGTDPIDYAIQLTHDEIDATTLIRDARRHTPSAYPNFLGDLTPHATARRIIGKLLDAGWQPPGGILTPPAGSTP